MKATALRMVLEVRACHKPSNNKAPKHDSSDDRARQAAMDAVSRGRIAGHDVLAVIDTSYSPEDPAWVPHYAYDAAHQGRLIDNGVWRYFGIAVVVEGEVGHEVFGTYEAGDRARVCVCGHNLPAAITTRPQVDLSRIENEHDQYKETTHEDCHSLVR